MGAFLREHGREVYPEIVATYSDTMNKVKRQFPKHGEYWKLIVLSFISSGSSSSAQYRTGAVCLRASRHDHDDQNGCDP